MSSRSLSIIIRCGWYHSFAKHLIYILSLTFLYYLNQVGNVIPIPGQGDSTTYPTPHSWERVKLDPRVVFFFLIKIIILFFECWDSPNIAHPFSLICTVMYTVDYHPWFTVEGWKLWEGTWVTQLEQQLGWGARIWEDVGVLPGMKSLTS